MLQLGFVLNLFSMLVEYRNQFQSILLGGLGIGITFQSSEMFLVNYIHSFIAQMLGIAYSGLSSLFVFVIESIPFCVFVVYLVINRQYSNKLVDFLIIFFVAYSTVWLLANDNLGTAVRLWIFSYILIMIAFLIVYQNKKIFFCKDDHSQSEPRSV